MSSVVEKKDTVYINYFDAIDMNRVRLLMQVCAQVMSKYQPETIYFLFASPGGEVNAGITLYNFLKSIHPKIVMHNMGAVDSIGTVVFLAGDERYANPHTTFLFHGVETGFRAQASVNLSKLKELLSGLSEDQNKISGIIAENTDISEEEIRDLFRQGESKNTDFALEKGFVHEVKGVVVPQGEIIINVSINPQN